jgi:hypothetical protein
LGYKKPPPAKEPLHKLSLPILRKAGEVAKAAPAGEEPIQELDDRVFWKVKIARWRGALLIPVESTGKEAWLTAAGLRRKGDADDFYTELGERARRWKAEYNRTRTPPISTSAYTDSLLPTHDDYDRIALEDSYHLLSDVRNEMASLVRQAAATGVEARGEAGGCQLGVLIRKGDLGEIYVAVRIVIRTIGTANQVWANVLDAVPAIADRDGWFIESMPDRESEMGEICWSNVFDDDALGEFLNRES